MNVIICISSFVLLIGFWVITPRNNNKPKR